MGRKQTYSLTSTQHNTLQALYQNGKRPRSALDDAAAEWGVPDWWITRYARNQGWTQCQQKLGRWHDAEYDLLEETLHLSNERAALWFSRRAKTDENIKPRSVTAICVMRKRQNLRSSDQTDYLNAAGVARLLGVNGKTVTTWLNNGLLKGQRRGTKRVDADEWLISLHGLKVFVTKNAAKVDPRKLTPDGFMYLVDVLTDSTIKPAKKEAA